MIAKKKIEAIGGFISTLNATIVAVKRTSLDEKALKRLGIVRTFSKIPSGITLKYRHDSITENGFLLVFVFFTERN